MSLMLIFPTRELYREKISKPDLVKLAQETYQEMIKAVVDLKKEIIALGGDLHADAEAKLIDAGSDQGDLWGINIYMDRNIETRIAYTSLINIRPNVWEKFSRNSISMFHPCWQGQVSLD